MSFTNLTTKTELVKSLQHFALNVKMYQNVISNVVNFWRHILPYLSFLMKDTITKKTVQVRRCHLQAKPRKQNSFKVYNILRYKFLRHILSYSSFPWIDIYEMKPFWVRKYHEHAKPRKKNTLKVYNILRWLSNFIQMWYWRKML